MVPTADARWLAMAPSHRESKHALSARAHALVPICLQVVNINKRHSNFPLNVTMYRPGGVISLKIINYWLAKTKRNEYMKHLNNTIIRVILSKIVHKQVL